jgi:hypothetical protein
MTNSTCKESLKNSRLLFKDVGQENRFVNNKLGFQKLCLKVLCLVIITQASAIFFFNPLRIDLMQTRFMIIFIVTMFAVLIIGVIISKKFPYLSSVAIKIIVVSFIVGASEYLKIIFTEINPTPAMYLMLGMNFQTGCLFLIISRIRWTYNFFFLSLLQIYIWIRAFDYEKNADLQKSVLLTLVLYLIILPYFCYAGELEDRRIFISMEKFQDYQKGFEDLLTNVIPSAIIMVQKGKIHFFNKTSKEMFLIDNQDELLIVFSHMQV